MPSRSVVALFAALFAVLGAGPATASSVLLMGPHGRVIDHRDRSLPHAPALPEVPRGAVRATPAAAPQKPRTAAVLSALLDQGAIDQATYDRARADYDRARQLARKLKGARRVAMRGVVADLDGMAARDAVVPARLPALLATLEANIRWWTTGPLLAPGARVEFAHSGIVWQHYAGHGIQIQWLGTWGRANGLWAAENQDAAFAALLAEAVGLGGQRAGGLAFEYLFPFDGGRPPWVSGLTQGTALSALVRGGLRLKDPQWKDAARSAVGIFRVPPPEGVAQPTADGTHYLQYSFAPRLHVLNGFIQSLNGLFDYASVLHDAEGQQLFDSGRAEAVAELPSYDTGGWSRYSNFRDSNLSYHELLRDFLRNLCHRLQRHGRPGDPFCHYAGRFSDDLVRAPRITLQGSTPRRLRARRRARVRFTLDKPATVTMVISRGRFAHRAVVPVASGPHSFGWKPPHAGRYAISLVARDLAGNVASTSTAAAVRRR
ncbi:MAG: hypothetical protein QOE60_482 [Thermoleophilaceae bacterium]|nr:hypothetical protein [Thermoleophilaceae bacterium]